MPILLPFMEVPFRAALLPFKEGMLTIMAAGAEDIKNELYWDGLAECYKRGLYHTIQSAYEKDFRFPVLT